jgi:hypothetical protein
MYNISVISGFGLDVNFQTDKPCELYVDRIPITPKTSVRVLWVLEPNEISGFKQSVINNYDKFDLILTWDKNILLSCPNAKLFPYGTTWIKDFEFPGQKEYCITTLIGGKTMVSGHYLRHQIPEISKLITSIPVHLYNSINTSFKQLPELRQMVSTSSKNEFFYSQFHIVIENVTSDNWFTEKIVDCFQTKTIPIYIGCENIGDFFDIKGIFHIKSLEEMVEVCNNITPETYQNMLDYVNINYEKSMNYHDHKKRLEDAVNLFISNN